MTTAFNDVGMTVTGTPGTGTITLGSAINTTYLTAAEAGVPTGTVVSYVIFDGTDIEGGKGTYTSAGTTLSRDTVTFSKIGGTAGTTKLTLTSAAEVRFTQLAADHIPVAGSSTISQFISVDSSGNLLLSTGGSERLRIDNAGRTIIGGYASQTVETQATLQLHSPGLETGAFTIAQWGNDSNEPIFRLAKSFSGTVGSHTSGTMQADEDFGIIRFVASDGTQFIPGAEIRARGDGTAGTNDMPGRLEFRTTADGAASATERMRIGNGGQTAATQSGSFTNWPWSFGNGGLGQSSFYAYNTSSSAQVSVTRFSAGATGGLFILAKSRGATVGSFDALNSGDSLGRYHWQGTDGSVFRSGAEIDAVTTEAWTSTTTGTAVRIFTVANGGTTLTERLRVTGFGDVCTAMAGAIATNATDGFLYVPTCAGTPTGTPTGFTGQAPIVVDTTNNKLYFRSGGAWRDAGP